MDQWQTYAYIAGQVLLTAGTFLLLWIRGMITTLIPKSWRFKDISGQVALVTGAGSGLGRGLSLRLAQRGAIVVALDLNKENVRETVKLVQAAGGRAYDFVCDVSKIQEVFEVAAQVKNQVGPVDILFNNAGVVSGRRFLQTSEEDVIRTFGVNTFANFWTCKAFLPDMRKKNHGHIITIASLAGLTGAVQLVDYCASKFAAVGFTEALRYEVAADGYDNIHFTCVCPFFINTGMFEGTQSRIVPILEQDYAVDQIMAAMLVNQKVLIMPKILYFTVALKSIVSIDAIDYAYEKLGGATFMSKFVGRAKAK